MDDEAGKARVLYFCITLVQQVFAVVEKIFLCLQGSKPERTRELANARYTT